MRKIEVIFSQADKGLVEKLRHKYKKYQIDTLPWLLSSK